MSAPVTLNIELQFAGAPFRVAFTSDDELAGIPLVCTVRRYQDGPIIASCSTADGGVVVDEDDDTQGTVTFWSDQTELWPLARLYYDVQADPNSLESYTLLEGRIAMVQKLTRSRTAALPIITGRLSASVGEFGLVAVGTNVNTGELAQSIGTFGLVATGIESSTLLDGLSVAPVAIYSDAARLFNAYTGPLRRVRKSTGGALADIGYGSNNRLDEAAQSAHVGADNGFLDTWYDQSGNARHLLSSVSTARQPKVHDSSTGVLKVGGSPASFYDDAADADELVVLNALGMSGNVNITIACVFTSADGPPATPGLFSIGAAGAGTILEAWAEGDGNTHFSLSIGGARRRFLCPNYTSGTHCVIFTRAAGQTVANMECYWNRTLLTDQAAPVNGGNTLNLGTAFTYAVGGTVRGIPLNGSLPFLAFFNAVLGSSDRNLIFDMATTLHETP